MSETRNDSNQKYVLSSLDNALTMLNLFFEKEELSVSDIATMMDINRSTAFRMLVTLERRGFLTKKENAKYRLGGQIFSLGQLAYSRMELISLVRPYLERISAGTKETAHLAVMEDSCHVIFVDKIIGSGFLKMDTPMGLSLYAHMTATGKSILAHKSERFIEQYMRSVQFAKNTEKSIGSAEALAEELARIRECGYAVDDEETEIGLTCYAMPILSASGEPLGAISSSGPTTRMAANKERYISIIGDNVRDIAASMR